MINKVWLFNEAEIRNRKCILLEQSHMPEFAVESTDVNSGLSSLWPQVPSGHEDSVPHQTVTGNLFKKVRNGGVITRVVKTIEPFYYMTSCRKEGALYTTISILYSSHDCCKCSLSHPLSFPRLLQVFSWISTWNSNLIKIKSKNLRSVLPCKSLVI